MLLMRNVSQRRCQCDQCEDRYSRSSETRVKRELVLHVEDKLTLGQSQDLAEKRDGVGRLFADKLPLGIGDGVPELILTRSVRGHLLLVSGSLLLHLSVHRAGSVSLGLSFGGARGVGRVVALGVFSIKQNEGNVSQGLPRRLTFISKAYRSFSSVHPVKKSAVV